MKEANSRKENLSVSVAGLLENDILNNVFSDNKLPSEQELGTRYSVSRTVVREALKLLSERHLVNIIVGSGAHITKLSTEDLTLVLGRLINTHNICMADAIDMRLILESNAASMASMNATDEELDRICEVSDMLSVEAEKEERVRLDLEFHSLINMASHNEMLSMITTACSAVTEKLISAAITAADYSPSLMKHISHKRICSALRDRNPFTAQSVVYDHIYTTKLMCEEYIAQKAEV